MVKRGLITNNAQNIIIENRMSKSEIRNKFKFLRIRKLINGKKLIKTNIDFRTHYQIEIMNPCATAPRIHIVFAEKICAIGMEKLVADLRLREELETISSGRFYYSSAIGDRSFRRGKNAPGAEIAQPATSKRPQKKPETREQAK